MKRMKRNVWVLGAVVILLATGFLIPPVFDQFSILTGYCLINRTCYRQSYCGGGGSGLGCTLGGYANVWKNETLGSRYKEISQAEAKECLEKYIAENASKYSKLQHLQLSTLKLNGETLPLLLPPPDEIKILKLQGNLYHDYRNVNPNDTHSYFAEVSTEVIPGDKYKRGYGLTFEIGAQSCTVYPDTSVYEPF